MTISERVTQDMKAAMVAQQKDRLAALRLIRAELLKAEKETGQTPDDAKQIAVLQKMLKQRQDSIEQFEKAGRMDLADKERAEAAIIGEFLPASLGLEDIKAAIEAVIADTGAPDPRQMGKLMGLVMARLKATGQPFDGKAVNELVKQRLGA